VRATILIAVIAGGLAVACSRDPDAARTRDAAQRNGPSVTVSADQAFSPVPPWRAPDVVVEPDQAQALRKRAEQALAGGNLYADANAALPLYLALTHAMPADARLAKGLTDSVKALLAQGDAALAGIDADPSSLRHAHEIAAVAREVAAADNDVQAFLVRLDRADDALQANQQGERELRAGRIGESGGPGAVSHFRDALRLRPGDARAKQGLAAAESALIRKAEAAAEIDDYGAAEAWIIRAARVRPGSDTIGFAHARLGAQRSARVRELRDLGIAALTTPRGLDKARAQLAALLRIAPAGDPAAVELRERIELAAHYGLFRPGQAFTDALRDGGRGPQMVVIPHGAFRMGSDKDGLENERPARNVRFDRGVAMARTEVTVGEFTRFMAATSHRDRARRRGYSIVYDEQSGNLVRRGGVDWRSDYAGRRALENLPVLHVSARDAAAYADWLSEQTGQRYRLPSEAEFEYALRAGTVGRFPWGDGAPPARSGNVTGALDESPTGRRWSNAFPGYGDGYWGPAPVGRDAANRYGLHDMAGNVAEWVADCWHGSYRRAPRGGDAWVNPGCRMRVVRGGSWASSPAQTRAAWRVGADADTTNARIGFRVVRDI